MTACLVMSSCTWKIRMKLKLNFKIKNKFYYKMAKILLYNCCCSEEILAKTQKNNINQTGFRKKVEFSQCSLDLSVQLTKCLLFFLHLCAFSAK